MNDKDLISALRGMAVETGSLVCLGCGHEHGCSLHGCAIIKKAAARLRVLTEQQAGGGVSIDAHCLPPQAGGGDCMSDGLKAKYIVRKSETGEAVENCFVLCPEKDPAAIIAIRAYAAATDNSTLAADLLRWVGSPPNDPLTLSELWEMDGKQVWIERRCSDDPDDRQWAHVDLEHYLCRTSNGELAYFELYGESWLAYRRKPEDTQA